MTSIGTATEWNTYAAAARGRLASTVDEFVAADVDAQALIAPDLAHWTREILNADRTAAARRIVERRKR